MVSSIGSSTATSMMQRLDTPQTSARVGFNGNGGMPPVSRGGGASIAPSGSTSSASSTSQSSSTSKTYDPADTNRDGIVSAQELLAYLNAHTHNSVSASQNQSSDPSVMKQRLSHAYGNSSQGTSQSGNGTLSVKA